MKRVVASFLVIILCLGLFACGGKPEGLSDNQYDAAIKAVETVDKYLDGKMDAEEANEVIDDIEGQFDWDDEDSSDVSAVDSRLSLLQADLMGDSSDKAIKEDRDKLADLINY